MRRCLCALGVCALLGIIPFSIFAQAPPTADAYVTDTQPSANFGLSSMLPVQQGTTTYLKLNLGILPAKATITKATLRLYVNAVASPGSFDVYQVQEAWTESGVNFNTAPRLGPSATGGRPVPVTSASQNQFLLIDVTPLAQAWLNGSVPNHGVALALAGAMGSFSFDSKESGGRQPELEIVFASAANSTSTVSRPTPQKGARALSVTQAPTDLYVNNSTALQTGTNFNIDGSGTAAIFNATSQYMLAGSPVLISNGTLNLLLGQGAGQSNSGVQNTFLGTLAGKSNTSGNYNSFTGTYSGYSNTTGTLLTFLGLQSGYSNTSGNSNTFVGSNSGYSNSTGDYNTFVGTGSGRFNSTGTQLTFVGMQSGFSNTTGNYNSFVGTYSGFSNTTGTLLTFLGLQSGYFNTTGNSNTFLGANAGYSNASGNYNAFVGAGSGRFSTTGSQLAFLGMQSGFSNTTGNDNSFVGTYSGFSNTTGSRNSFLGSLAGYPNTTGSSNVFVGYNAGANSNAAGNNNIYISSPGQGADNGVVRIGDPANQTSVYLAGIYGNSPGGALPVVVNAAGQLGTSAAPVGVTSFNGRSGAVVSASGDYDFSQISGTLPGSQLSGTYSSPVVLSNTTNVFSGSFIGDGAGLSGVASGLNWSVVTKSADYAVQISDFATATTHGNYLILTGTVSHTFTLPNPPPANGSCVAIGNVADPGVNSGTNVFLTVSPNGVNMDTVTSGNSVLPTMPRRTAYLYCSDGANYFRLGYQQNGVSEIGPWLYTLDTGVVDALTTTFRNGMDFGLNTGSMIFILPKFANITGTPTLNVNGLGVKKILKHGNLALSPGDLSTTALALLIYDGTFWELINPQTIKSTLTGTTGTVGGSSLAAGTCATGTASVTGAVIGHPVAVSASDGSLPNPLTILSASVTSANLVSVQVCAVAAVTPAAVTYNVATE